MSKLPDYLIERDPAMEQFAGDDGAFRAPLRIDGVDDIPPGGMPVRCGAPIPVGVLSPGSGAVRLLDPAGNVVPVQAEPTGYWRDGSIKWVLLDWIAAGREYTVEIGGRESPEPDEPVSVNEHGDTVVVTTGAVCVELTRSAFAPIGRVLARDADGEYTRLVCEGGDMLVSLEDAAGELSGEFRACTDFDYELVVERSGPIRATVRMSGWHVADDGRRVDPWTVRLHAFAGLSCLQLDHTFVNNVDVRTVGTRAVSVELATPTIGETARIAADGGTVDARTEGGLSVLQVNAEPKRFPKFDQFRPECRVTASGSQVASAEKADGWLATGEGDDALAVGVRDFWRKYPKGLAVEPDASGVRIDIQPAEAGPLDWFAGVDPDRIAPTGAPWQAFGDDGIALSHEIVVGFGADAAGQAGAFCGIARAVVDGVYACATRAMGCLAPRDPDVLGPTERRLDRMIEWLHRHQTEWFGWYGTVNYGNIQTHYQPAFGHWSDLTERFGWLNAESETAAAAGLAFLRSGDERAFELMRSGARCIADVGHVHLGPRRGHGRRHFALAWGQPGDWDHTFLRAQTLYWRLTGDDRMRDAIDEVAELVDRSEPRKGYLRDATNFQRCALWCYEITGDEKFRDKAAVTMQSVLDCQDEFGRVEKTSAGPGNQFHTNEYLLWATMLYDLVVGDERVRELTVALMDYQASPEARDERGTGRRYQWEGWQQAWLATGNDRYIWPALRDLTTIDWRGHYCRFDPILRFPSVGRPTHFAEPEGEVRPETYVAVHFVARNLTKIPYFLYAATAAGIRDAGEYVSTSVDGIVVPWSADPGDGRDTAWRIVDLSGACNAAPLSPDPFEYTEMPISRHLAVPAGQIEQTGRAIDNLSGLPWGARVHYAGVPYALAAAAGPGDDAMVCLKPGESVGIPVGVEAKRLHLLGQVLGRGNMDRDLVAARYRIRYGDGGEDVVEWRNLIHCEDWRYQYTCTGAAQAVAWAPLLFAGGVDVENPATALTRLRHLNTLTVDTHGRRVEELIFESGDWDSRPMLLAVTAETDDAPPVAQPVDVTDEPTESASAETLRLPVGPGRGRIELTIEASSPMGVDVAADGQNRIDGWHLTGRWGRGDHPQRISLDVDAGADGVSLEITPRTAHVYEPNENGRTPWGLGWYYDRSEQRWRFDPHPRWNVLEVRFTEENA